MGLKSGARCRWLEERFSERTGIEVNYESDFNERLHDEQETMYFVSFRRP